MNEQNILNQIEKIVLDHRGSDPNQLKIDILNTIKNFYEEENNKTELPKNFFTKDEI